MITWMAGGLGISIGWVAIVFNEYHPFGHPWPNWIGMLALFSSIMLLGGLIGGGVRIRTWPEGVEGDGPLSHHLAAFHHSRSQKISFALGVLVIVNAIAMLIVLMT